MEEREQKAITTIKPHEEIATINDKPQVGLDEAPRKDDRFHKRLAEFLAQISQISDRGDLRLFDGQQVQLTFNIDSVINNIVKRTIHTPQGPKEIVRFMWDANLNGRRKIFELALRWSRRKIEKYVAKSFRA